MSKIWKVEIKQGYNTLEFAFNDSKRAFGFIDMAVANAIVDLEINLKLIAKNEHNKNLETTKRLEEENPIVKIIDAMTQEALKHAPDVDV